MNVIETLKIFALLFSIAGATLVAKRSRKMRLYGFGIWILSNLIWIADSLLTGNTTQTLLWIYYLFACAIGIKNNL